MVVARGNPLTRGWLFGGTAYVQEGVEKVNAKYEVRSRLWFGGTA